MMNLSAQALCIPACRRIVSNPIVLPNASLDIALPIVIWLGPVSASRQLQSLLRAAPLST